PAAETAPPTPADSLDHGGPDSARTAHGRGPRARSGDRTSARGARSAARPPGARRRGRTRLCPPLTATSVLHRIGHAGSPPLGACARRITSRSFARGAVPARPPIRRYGEHKTSSETSLPLFARHWARPGRRVVLPKRAAEAWAPYNLLMRL